MSNFRYRLLANQLIEELLQGRFSAGERLPSIRQLSQDRQLSKGTVIRAYEYLERSGWIEAREKSGFYPTANRLVTTDTEEASNPSAEQLEALAPKRLDNKSLGLEVVRSATRGDLVPLGSANPCVSFPGVKRLYQLLKQEISEEEAQLSTGYLAHYQTPPGAERLRLELSRQLSKQQIRCTPDEILITNGAQSAVTLALQATTREGDIVLIESPCFYGILQCLEAFDRKVIEIPQAHCGGPDLTLVATALAQWPVKAIIVQPTLNNPTGKTMPEPERRQLIALADQYDIAIIEDDIFAELHYRGNAPSPLKALDKENRVLYCSSVSKTITPKLRLGWLLAGRWQERCRHLQFVSKMGLPAHTQNALGRWFEAGYLNRHLRRVRRYYQQRQQLFQQALAECWPNNLGYQPAEGGFLAWIELPEHCDAMALYEAAQAQNINITPGPLFGSADINRHCIRLNFALFHSQPDFLRAMAVLGHLIRDQASALGETSAGR